jgi:hypothetical protein
MDIQQDEMGRAPEIDWGVGGKELITTGDAHQQAGTGRRFKVKRLVAGYFQRIGFDPGLLESQRKTRLRKYRAGIVDNQVFGKLNHVKMQGVQCLVPDEVVDGFVTIRQVPNVAGVYGGYNRFIADNLDTKGRMREEQDNGIGGMQVGRGRVASRDFPFQQPEIGVFHDDFMMRLPVDRNLGLQAGGKQEESQKKVNILHSS